MDELEAVNVMFKFPADGNGLVELPLMHVSIVL
jgi:hypothetical protein